MICKLCRIVGEKKKQFKLLKLLCLVVVVAIVSHFHDEFANHVLRFMSELFSVTIDVYKHDVSFPP